MATATRTMDREAGSIEVRPIPEGWHRGVLDMSPDVYDLLERLAGETGAPKVEVIRKALGLYAVAIDARREGLTVGAVSDDQPLDTEFVGF